MERITNEDIRVLHECTPGAICCLGGGEPTPVIRDMEAQYQKVLDKVEKIKATQEKMSYSFVGK